jgi:hypothetical protein
MALETNIIGGASGAKADVDSVTLAQRSFVPRREASGTLAAINAEVVLALNGEASASIWINGTGTANGTYTIQGSADGINYADVLTYPMPQFCVGGTIPLAGQPIITEAVNAATVQRLLCVAVGQLKNLRLRLTAYTGGSFAVLMIADQNESISPYVRSQRSATLMVTATGAAGAAVTATLPALAGMRHYIDFISVTRFATALLTAGATPVLVTTTNISGAPVLSHPADAAGAGVATQQDLDFGASGVAATALNTATTVVCPVTTAVIWRVNVAYRLGA